jgi:hypothetical protein
MFVLGNIRKMQVENASPVQYTLPLFNNLHEGEYVTMNDFVGKQITIRFTGTINCVVTGKKINKSFGEGMSYDAWKSSPMAVESIINPELDTAHLGIGLRDLEWERERHVQPHYVYLAQTHSIKVGVTRENSIPSRWIDQGAWKALKFACTPYRQKAGIIETELKAHITDKTNWRKMLTDEKGEGSFEEEHSRLKDLLPRHLKQFVLPYSSETVTEIEYPVLKYPEKVKSFKLDSRPEVTETLVGIRGQYLIFADNSVINMRSHAGYQISISDE